MKIVKKCQMILMCLILTIMFPLTVCAESISGLQTNIDDETVVVFLPDLSGEVLSVKAQIGNIANAEIEIKECADAKDYSTHTTILFDNSLSIPEENREQMKEIAKGIVNNHVQGEVFSLYTIDTELREVISKSTDYEQVSTKLEGIEYSNQETYLKNDLYDAFSGAKQEPGVFQRFIIFSDGTDDNSLGYTYNDITRIIDENHYAVSAVGAKYEKKIKDLEDMFSIARAAGSTYVLLDSNSVSEEIVDRINACVPQYIAMITIPENAKNGSEQKIKISISTSEGEYTYVSSVEMPFAEIIEDTGVESENDAIEQEETVKADSGDEESVKKGVNPVLIIAVIMAAICAAIVSIVLLKKRKTTSNIEGSQTEAEEDDRTVLLQEDEGEDEDEDATILMQESDEESTYIAKTVIMIAEDKSREFEFKCSTDIKIGRKDCCEVQIKGDKSVSGIHCIISCDQFGNPAIRDNNSSNGTYLNDEKLVGEQGLKTGDTVEIGRLRYTITIKE